VSNLDDYMSPGTLAWTSSSGRFIASTAPSAEWFAVYTTPRHEKAVHKHFEARRIESFLPLYREIHRWRNGRRVEVEGPLFPSYLFTRIERGECVRVLAVPGVVSLLGSGSVPSAVSDFEIESLRSGLHLREFEPHSRLVVGRKVRITAGALAGMVGILIRKKNSFRVVLTLELIMRSVAVEVDLDELEPLRGES
jgi:transcription antitermination factor NusG